MNNVKPIILIDAESYFYGDLSVPSRLRDDNSFDRAYNLISVIRNSLIKNRASQIAVFFSNPFDKNREMFFPGYNSHRKDLYDSYSEQIELVKNISESIGVPFISSNESSNLDIISSVSQALSSNNINSIIVSCDLSYAQNIGPRISVVEPFSDTTLNKSNFLDKSGVLPDQVSSFLAMYGENGNNIETLIRATPGAVSGWLREYGSIDGILDNKGSIQGRAIDELVTNQHRIMTNKSLITPGVVPNVDKYLSLISRVGVKPDVLYPLYIENNYEEWLPAKMQGDIYNKKINEDKPFVVIPVTNRLSLDDLVAKLDHQGSFSIVTNGPEKKEESISISFNNSFGYYIPLNGQDSSLNFSRVMASLKPILENGEVKKVSTESKALYKMLYRSGIELSGLVSDAQVLSYTIDTGNNKKSLNKIYDEIFPGESNKSIGIEQNNEEKGVLKAIKSWKVNRKLYKFATNSVYSRKVYEEYENPLIKILAKMESDGVEVDGSVFLNQAEAINKKLNTIQSDIRSISGSNRSISTPSEIAALLYEDLGLPVLRKTPKGLPSTDGETLALLAKDHKVPALIIEHRALSKLNSTYTLSLHSKIEKETDPSTGIEHEKIKCSFNQTVTATGRLSSSDPNLQNIPTRSIEGRKIRAAFTATTDGYLVSADYSQIELRVLAHLSGDKGLIEAFNNNKDIHISTAAEIFNTPEDKVTKEQRQSAKAINFGLIYGKTSYGLSKDLGITEGQAKSYIQLYFSRYPQVLTYLEGTKKKAESLGYVETISGRRLYIKGIDSPNFGIREAAKRVATNAPMQGSASDIIKKAMIIAAEWLSSNNMKSKLILQVHDELVFDATKDEAKLICEQIPRIMSEAADLLVPLTVDVEIGTNLENGKYFKSNPEKEAGCSI